LESDWTRLASLLTRLACEIRPEPIRLTSGGASNLYIDTKQATLTAEGHYLVGTLILAKIRRRFPAARAVGGMTMGADPIASAVSFASYLETPALDAFYVRKEPKRHGTGQWIEGLKALSAGTKVVVVEDVLTSGSSALRAVERCRGERLDVLGVVALVDREEGGKEALVAAGIQTHSLFVKTDLHP
jgi:orotate phosphoribosyltransferase